MPRDVQRYCHRQSQLTRELFTWTGRLPEQVVQA